MNDNNINNVNPENFGAVGIVGQSDVPSIEQSDVIKAKLEEIERLMTAEFTNIKQMITDKEYKQVEETINNQVQVEEPTEVEVTEYRDQEIENPEVSVGPMDADIPMVQGEGQFVQEEQAVAPEAAPMDVDIPMVQEEGQFAQEEQVAAPETAPMDADIPMVQGEGQFVQEEQVVVPETAPTGEEVPTAPVAEQVVEQPVVPEGQPVEPVDQNPEFNPVNVDSIEQQTTTIPIGDILASVEAPVVEQPAAPVMPEPQVMATEPVAPIAEPVAPAMPEAPVQTAPAIATIVKNEYNLETVQTGNTPQRVTLVDENENLTIVGKTQNVSSPKMTLSME